MVSFFENIIIFKSGTLIVALKKRGKVWSNSYLVKKIFFDAKIKTWSTIKPR